MWTDQTITETNRIEALEKFLDASLIDEVESNGDFMGTVNTFFDTEQGEFAVLTDEEANEAARECIEESVWAFNKSFLDCHSDAISELDNESFKVLQERCEASNKAIKAMIDDFDHFVDDAISADGRGHFLSHYDGEEHEETDNEGNTFFIYQLN